MIKRIAAPMVGGLATSFLLELLVYPAVYFLWKRREVVPGPAPPRRMAPTPPRCPPDAARLTLDAWAANPKLPGQEYRGRGEPHLWGPHTLLTSEKDPTPRGDEAMAQLETQKPAIHPFLPVGGPPLSDEMKACIQNCLSCSAVCLQTVTY